MNFQYKYHKLNPPIIDGEIVLALAVGWPSEILHEVVPVVPLISQRDFSLGLRVDHGRSPAFDEGSDQLHRDVGHVPIHVVEGEVEVVIEIPTRVGERDERACFRN